MASQLLQRARFWLLKEVEIRLASVNQQYLFSDYKELAQDSIGGAGGYFKPAVRESVWGKLPACTSSGSMATSRFAGTDDPASILPRAIL